ncbi:hypothetical protein [Sphingobacterium suaedae]|uniref:Uncharacterized protein n=1 Tax=Sphingobacterium suaedae TaxID=1686402 RepID=A0ABW5KFF5_9SPHI
MGLFDFFKKKKEDNVASPDSSQATNAVDRTEQQNIETRDELLKATQENDSGYTAEKPTENSGVSDSVPSLEIDAASSTPGTLMETQKEDTEAFSSKGLPTPDKKQDFDEVKGALIDRPTLTENAEYLGNLEHTAIIDQLLRIPREERGEEWIVNFLSHVVTASFVCGEPQVIQGPDNFPYFQLFVPEPNTPFQCYVIEHMISDFLLENGIGIALEPKDGQVEWVLTYGDLLHYAAHKTFAIPADHPFGKSKEGDEVIQEDEQVLVGAPSAYVLPDQARHVIKNFLEAQGVKEPKVCLIDRNVTGKGQDLVFNLVPWQFENQAHYRAVMQALGWFLPGYYSYIGAQEDAFAGHFLPL